MPANVQPYQPPQADLTVHCDRDVKRLPSQRWWLLPFLYPPVLMATFYGVWLIAWFELGHMPRPSLDDPNSIGGVFRFFVILPLLVLLPYPMMLPLGFIGLLYLRIKGSESVNYRRWWLLLASYILLWGLTFWCFHWDPLGVGNWYGD